MYVVNIKNSENVILRIKWFDQLVNVSNLDTRKNVNTVGSLVVITHTSQGALDGTSCVYCVESHEMDSLLKRIFSNPNGIFTCYSMYLNR